MWQAIWGFIQILFFLLKNNFETKEEEQKKKEVLYVEAKEAIKSGDRTARDRVLARLRKS